jgi:hypothetical protein
MKTNTLTPIPVNLAERRVGISQDTYLSLFLTEEDIGGKMYMEQDTRLQGPDTVEVAFPKYQGLFAGFACWMAGVDQPVMRVVDIRWVFPTCWQASAFHAAQLDINSEGNPPLLDALPVGEECRVFYAKIKMPQFVLRHFFYIFRLGRVVVKLYCAQGFEAPVNSLKIEQVAQIARRIEKRVRDIID